MNLQTQFKKKQSQKKRSSRSFSVKCLITKCEKDVKAESSKEDELEGDEDIKELIKQVKMLNKVMEYCSKNPKECE